MSNQIRSEKRIKQDARQIKKETGCSHNEALNIAVEKIGFTNYLSYKEALKPKDLLSEQELRRELVRRSIDFAIFIPTENGLNKSILDATAPMRSLFQAEQFHNYSDQKQGPAHKVITEAFFITPNKIQRTVVSLYRPHTKQGDPRMWFKGLKEFASPNDSIAIIFRDKIPFLLNLSAPYDKYYPFEFLDSITIQLSSIARELLRKLKEIAKNPISSTVKGSTAVGMAVEAALNIPPNSNKKPDYKGIELKSTRSRTNTRKGLFTQVAKWDISKITSSKELLETYGYNTERGLKLNCTVSILKTNPQGLILGLDADSTELHEIHTNDGSILIWPLSLLTDRLLEKHAETFWIEVDSEVIDNKELFHLKSVIHTKSPLISQLIPLIEEGAITLDHMIKINSKGSTEERGPAFKLKPSHLSLLFPSPVKYNLID